MMKMTRYILLVCLLLWSGCSRQENIKGVHVVLQKSEIRQRYGGEMGALADELKEAGVNLVISPVMENGTAYYPSDVLPQRWEYGTQLLAFRHELRRRHIRFAAYIPVFRDAYTYRSQPNLRAVSEYDNPAGSEPLAAICPRDPEYRRYKLAAVREVMLILQPDAVYFGDLAFPLESSDPCDEHAVNNARSYCFCTNCQQAFSDYAGISLPRNSSTAAETAAWILENHLSKWVQWKSEVITSFLEQAHHAVREINPDCSIMLSVLPWTEDQFDHGRRRLSGQDIRTLSPFLTHVVLHPAGRIPQETLDSIRIELDRELEISGGWTVPSLDPGMQPASESNEREFQRNLQYFRKHVIVSDWGYLLKYRRYLNIFKSEPIL